MTTCHWAGSVRPTIVPTDRETPLEIKLPFQQRPLENGQEYQVRCTPAEQFAERSGWPANATHTVRADNHALRISLYFEGEQEHVLQVLTTETPPRELGQFRVYSLKPDLFARRPWKGDTHLHSYCSDAHESPAYVAGACRRIGLDFMAVTDHRQYAPSLEAQTAFAAVPHDLRIYPGEEIHPPNNPVHMVNFGGRFGVHALCEGAAYPSEVAELQRTLGPLPPGVDPVAYASCVWVFNKIREGGGLGVFCHPYWFNQMHYTPSGALTTHLLDTQPFGALELIGGYFLHETESNTLQVARYHEERANGRRIPIVGASDSHGCETGKLFGWYYSIVFSPSPELPDLIDSIRDLYSVAVTAVPGQPGVAAQAHGPFRLVKYALFLMREVFPLHDDLCREEGRLMLAHVAGDPEAGPALTRLNGRCAALYNALWAD